MKYRQLAKLLAQAGFERSQGKGDYERWKKGAELVIITQTREVSPGLTRKALQAIERTMQEDE